MDIITTPVDADEMLTRSLLMPARVANEDPLKTAYIFMRLPCTAAPALLHCCTGGGRVFRFPFPVGIPYTLPTTPIAMLMLKLDFVNPRPVSLPCSPSPPQADPTKAIPRA